MDGTNLVVVGASAGGVAELRRIVAALPADFDAALLVAVHVGAHRSVLPDLLASDGRLPAAHAAQHEPLLPARIYVAPPDRHLLVAAGRVELSRGPKEHHTRPAIDPLFRSAALGATGALVGVLLSGRLSDGTAGLQAVKRSGGMTVVQDPAGAEEPGMLRSALHHAQVDHCVPTDEIAPLLVELLRGAAPARGEADADSTAALEQRLFLGRGDAFAQLARVGSRSPFACPECGGSLWELDRPGARRFRCHAGHAYALDTLREAQASALDEALWAAYSALQERERLLQEIAAAAVREGRERDATEHEAEALDARAQLATLRGMLEGRPTALVEAG